MSGSKENKIVVNARAAARVAAGHLWIYRGEIHSAESIHGGAVVDVVSQRGEFVARAFYSSRSMIALRVLTNRKDERVDRDFFRRKICEAAARREGLRGQTSAYRIVNGEGDQLPSLILDRYNDFFVLQTLSQGMDQWFDCLLEILEDEFHPEGVVERNDAKTRELEGLENRVRVAAGTVPEAIEYQENGLRFCARLLGGQKTGAFLDQRENHAAAARYARGRALDGFSYAGGFAMHLAPKCESVVAVESSAESLELARRNAGLNGFSNITFIEANVFDYLRELEKSKECFDIIVLDPPAFAKSRSHLESAERGYKEINLRAMKLLNAGGVLVTCSCSQLVSENHFLNILAGAAADMGARFSIIEKRTQGRDHPYLLSMPETLYLKCVILRKLS